MNEMCHVTTEEPALPQYFVEFEDRTNFFCCARCRGRFQRDPETFRPVLVAMGAIDDLHEHAHDDEHGRDARATEHEHDNHHGEVPQPFAWLGNFHPMSVHLPIGLLIGAVIAEVLMLLFRRKLFTDAARFCIWAGAANAMIAAPLGWFNAGWEIAHDGWIMGMHRWLGTLALLWSIALVVLDERAYHHPDRPRRRTIYLTALFLGAILIAATGHFGGMLVYGPEYYKW